MDKLKAIFQAFLKAPIIAPLLDILQHRAVITLLFGALAYLVIPQIQGVTPDTKARIGDLVFFGGLLLVGRFSIEGILTAKAGLPATAEDYIRALLTEVTTPTAEKSTINVSQSSDTKTSGGATVQFPVFDIKPRTLIPEADVKPESAG